VIDVAPSVVRRNSGVSPLVTNYVKNRVDCNLIICFYLIKQEDPCPKSVGLTNVVTVVSKLLNFIASKGTSQLQFKDFRRDLKSGYKAAVCYVRMLKCVYDMKSEIECFREMKG
jgi:hypothetical protein